MTSERISYGRREYTLDVAEKAKIFLASETDDVEIKWFLHSKTDFLRRFPQFGDDWRMEDDDKDMDLMALVVLDDLPTETINDILRMNKEVTSEQYLWLADDYETLPDWSPQVSAEGTLNSVAIDWRSPFTGSSVQDVAAFIQAAPKPPKPLCKRFFAVLEKERFEQSKQLLIYKILDETVDGGGGDKLQAIPCPAHLAGLFFAGYDRGYWDEAFEDQALYFNEGRYWDEDDADNQVMALIVLDDFPTKTLDRILTKNAEDTHPYLWLADEYNYLPDYRPNYNIAGTPTPIPATWRSPFIGKSIEDAANFVRNAPKPPKPLSRRFFAVLQKELFNQKRKMLICRISPDHVEDELQIDHVEDQGIEASQATVMSLICKEQQPENPGEEAMDATSAVDNIDIAGQHDQVESSVKAVAGRFKVETIEYDAAQVGNFFNAFDRSLWSAMCGDSGDSSDDDDDDEEFD